MKKFYFFLATLLLSTTFYTQISSDFNTVDGENEVKKPLNYTSYIGCSKSSTISGTLVNSCDSGSTVLTYTGACNYSWYADSSLTTILATNDSLATGQLFGNTNYYLSTIEPDSSSALILPAHASTFSGNVRGYYFQAPCDFVITGLRVPTEADPGAQNIAVVKFNNGAPPLWSGTTNDFVELGYWANYSLTDTIDVCISVDSLDFIGIFGNRNDNNSYAPSPATSSINGYPVILTRSGMQQNLSSNSMANIFSESGGSISRVEMFYSTDLDTITSLVEVIVPQSITNNDSLSACIGDSILFQGNYYGSNTTIVDSSLTSYNCDSITITDLIFYDCTSIIETNNSENIFPNPFKDNVTLQFNVDYQLLTIYNQLGSLVFQKNINGLNEININTESFSSGIYIVNLTTQDKVKSIKIIKE